MEARQADGLAAYIGRMEAVDILSRIYGFDDALFIDVAGQW